MTEFWVTVWLTSGARTVWFIWAKNEQAVRAEGAGRPGVEMVVCVWAPEIG